MKNVILLLKFTDQIYHVKCKRDINTQFTILFSFTFESSEVKKHYSLCIYVRVVISQPIILLQGINRQLFNSFTSTADLPIHIIVKHQKFRIYVGRRSVMIFSGNSFLSYNLCNLFNTSHERVTGIFVIQVLYLSK